MVFDSEGNLELKTHPNSQSKQTHLVSKLIKRVENNNDQEIELNHFSLIVRKSHDKPRQLTVAFQTNADGDYHVEIVTDCPDKKLSLSGSHAWLRLIDDEGRVISVGKFPEDLKIPFLYRKEATQFATTDRHEWLCKGTINKHRFTITQAHFNQLREDIEKDLQGTANPERNGQQDFNVFGENCSDWAIEKVEKIGLEINKKRVQIDQFTLLYPNLSVWYENKMPQKIRVVTDPLKSVVSFLTLQIFRVALITIFGGTQKNSQNKDSKRFLSIKQVFNHRLTHLTHPWRVCQYLDQERDNIQMSYWNNSSKTAITA